MLDYDLLIFPAYTEAIWTVDQVHQLGALKHRSRRRDGVLRI